MVEIELKYKGKAIELIQIPSKWADLTSKQLLYVAEKWQLLRSLALQNQSLLKEKALLFIEMMNGNTLWNKKKRVELIRKADNEELYCLTQLTNFIFEANTLINCPLPAIGARFRNKFGMTKCLYAPADGMVDIKAMEFHFADKYYLRYVDTKEISELETLICILYRPRIKGKEVRVPFDKDVAEKYMKRIKKLSYAEKQLILLWYIGCRNFIVKKYPTVFTATADASAGTANAGFIPVILEIAGNKFGTFDETGAMDLHLILMELERMIAGAEKRNETKN